MPGHRSRRAALCGWLHAYDSIIVGSRADLRSVVGPLVGRRFIRASSAAADLSPVVFFFFVRDACVIVQRPSLAACTSAVESVWVSSPASMEA